MDPRKGNPVKERLKEGGTVLGCFVRIPAPSVIDLSARLGFDFVVLDAEHTPLSDERCGELVLAAEASGIVPIVRVPQNHPDVIARFLETGAMGIQVPRVRSAAEALSAARAARYAPEGERGLATGRGAGWGLTMSLPEYTAAANAATMVVLQVEDATVVDSLPEILAVPGLDVLFVGTTDLSQSMGIPGQAGDPRVREVISRILAHAKAFGKPVGFPVLDVAPARSYQEQGGRYLTITDVRLLSKAGLEFLRGMREG